MTPVPPLLDSPLDAYLRQYANQDVALPYWTIDLMQACTRLSVSSYNFKAMVQNSVPESEQLMPLAKSSPGLGIVPEFAPASYEWRFGDAVPEIAVGPEQFGLHFPKLKVELAELTTEQIVDLGIFYNEDFGIGRDDSLSEQRRKTSRFFGVLVLDSDHERDLNQGEADNDLSEFLELLAAPDDEI